MRYISLLILFISIILLACSSSDNSTNTTTVKTPTISVVSPTQATVSYPITITGTNFGATRGTNYVEFSGVNALNTANYINWCDTLITIVVPQYAVSGNIYVHVGDLKSSGYNLTIGQLDTSKTQITFILPDSGKVGDNNISIFGTKFTNSKTNNYVLFNNLKVVPGSWTNNCLSAISVPTGAVSGVVKVVVNGDTSNSVSFKVVVDAGTPVITGLSSSEAKAGTDIEIYGYNFGDSRTASCVVSFNGTQPSSSSAYTSWTNNKIIVTIPLTATTGNVYVTISHKISAGYPLTIDAANPNDPYINYLGQTTFFAGKEAIIYGSNFGSSQGSSVVYFGSLQASSYTSWSDTKIVAVAPKKAVSGKLYVVVGGVASNTKAYNIQAQNYLINMVTIPAGQFTMGTNAGDDIDDKPAHTVNITKSFYMGKYEVTQKEWSSVMSGSNPSKWPCDSCPVEQITFNQALTFCNTLSTQTGLTPCYTISGDNYTCDFSANGFRLPTEAEWEYACRAGVTGDYSTSTIDAMGWTNDNTPKSQPQAIGLKSPNAFGLYDMFGNVYEWCWDYYQYDYYSSSPTNDPTGPTSSDTKERILRGGSYQDSPDLAQPFKRLSITGVGTTGYNFNYGFRVVRKVE